MQGAADTVRTIASVAGNFVVSAVFAYLIRSASPLPLWYPSPPSYRGYRREDCILVSLHINSNPWTVSSPFQGQHGAKNASSRSVVRRAHLFHR